MPGTVNQRASPRYLPKTNVGFVREKSLLYLILPLDKSHFITEVCFMEIRVLRYFLTVAREGGINRAAEVLHLTQPTLSRQMSSLEDEVGVRLFQRGAKKITLTNEGILLRRRAEEILALVDKTEKELIEQEKLVDGKITVGCGELAAMQLLPDIIRSFSKKYPLVSYDLYTVNADEVKEQMEKGLVDIGVLLEPVDIEKFDFIRLEKTERWVVLM